MESANWKLRLRGSFLEQPLTRKLKAPSSRRNSPHTLPCLTRLNAHLINQNHHAPFPHSCRPSATSLFRGSSNSSFCRGAYIGASKCIARQRRVGQCSRAPLLKASGRQERLQPTLFALTQDAPLMGRVFVHAGKQQQ